MENYPIAITRTEETWVCDLTQTSMQEQVMFKSRQQNQRVYAILLNTFTPSEGTVNKGKNNMKHDNHGINLNSSCNAPLLSHSKCPTIPIAERRGGMYSSDLKYDDFWALLDMVMNRLGISKLGSLIGSVNHIILTHNLNDPFIYSFPSFSFDRTITTIYPLPLYL
jgi:hypothetical protein